MKCTSCVSASRAKSDEDEEDEAATAGSQQPVASSPVRAMDKLVEEENYRVESPPPPLPDRPSLAARKQQEQHVSIVEVPADFRGEPSRIYEISLEKQHSPSPSSSSSSHLLRPPLDVITEENSDVSDSENRTTPKPDLCFPRPKPRFKKAKSRNLLKNLFQVKQEPTTCVLVDAKISESSPEEYRSICTTEVVPEEILEVEVIDLGSNSSSLEDLTDLDGGEDVASKHHHIADIDEDKIINSDNRNDSNNNEDQSAKFVQRQTEEKQKDDNGNDNQAAITLTTKTTVATTADDASDVTPNVEGSDDDGAETPTPPPFPPRPRRPREKTPSIEATSVAVEEVLSEEDNNGYELDDDRDYDQHEGENKTNENFRQPPADLAASQIDDDVDDSEEGDDSVFLDDDDEDADYVDDREDDDDRPESAEDRDDEENDQNDDDDGSLLAVVGRASVVTQSLQRDVNKVPDLDSDSDRKRITSDEEQSSIDCAAVTHQRRSENGDPCVVIESGGDDEDMSGPAPAIPMPPPPAALKAAGIHVASSQPPDSETAAAVTNLGQDDERRREQTSPTDSAGSENAQIHSGSDTGEVDHADVDPVSEKDSGDAVAPVPRQESSSVLLKILQDRQQQVSVENCPTFDEQHPTDQQIFPSATAVAAAWPKIDHAVKSEQLNYEIVQDHRRVLREETVTTSTSTSSSDQSEVILRRQPNRPNEPSSTSGKEPSPEQKAALVHDLRNEISRIKDAELQEEFRKLELEAARIEEELGKISTTMPTTSQSSLTSENLTYYVSKQNDFAVERLSAASRQKPPAAAATAANGVSAAKPPPVAHNNDQLYNEWQQKMEEREARRLHKVVKLSNKPNNDPPSQNGGPEPPQIPPPPKPPAIPPRNQQQEEEDNEFLRTVKERRRKFTIQDNSVPQTPTSLSAPTTPLLNRKPIPKHIEAEFAEFAELRRRQQEEAAATEEAEQSKPVESRQPIKPDAYKPNQQPQPISLPATAPIKNGSSVANIENSEEEPVKVSTLIEVHQQKQRQLLRQDSYKNAVSSVANSTENVSSPERNEDDEEEPKPISVSAKCQEFERRLQRSASGDGRRPLGSMPTPVACNFKAPDNPIPPAPREPPNPYQGTSAPIVLSAPPSSAPPKPARIGSYSEAFDCNTSEFVVNRNANSHYFTDTTDTTSASNCHGRHGNQQQQQQHQLQQQRRSFSEADLLHEIDRALVLAKDFLFSRGNVPLAATTTTAEIITSQTNMRESNVFLDCYSHSNLCFSCRSVFVYQSRDNPRTFLATAIPICDFPVAPQATRIHLKRAHEV
ncbi:uncharacterized protein LOC129751970 [Uranotaenia lowii]|uniref:uncharacterized protein LOC129751970 n=1 Tax=Uranotaenia lowii TaxID=190385 RepID=UPI002478B850|nr:uncharacterized protein LOC129751970 [Uranotaenia lowii]